MGLRRPWLAVSLAALAGLVGGLGIQSLSAPEPPPRTPTRLNLLTPGEANLRGRSVAISRDGKRIAYVALNQIWLRDLEELEARPLSGTEGGTTPFFSPDGG